MHVGVPSFTQIETPRSHNPTPPLPLLSALRFHGSAKTSTQALLRKASILFVEFGLFVDFGLLGIVALRVHGSAKTSTLALLRKASILFVEFGLFGLRHPVRRFWTPGDCGAPRSFHGQNKWCVTLWPFTLKSILMQKKNYETQIFHRAKI
jgi:hypothetical protein